jgi:hypothetical protein
MLDVVNFVRINLFILWYIHIYGELHVWKTMLLFLDRRLRKNYVQGDAKEHMIHGRGQFLDD